MEQIEQIILAEKYHKLDKGDIKSAKKKVESYYGFIPPGYPKCQVTMANLRQKSLIYPANEAKLVFLRI